MNCIKYTDIKLFFSYQCIGNLQSEPHIEELQCTTCPYYPAYIFELTYMLIDLYRVKASTKENILTSILSESTDICVLLPTPTVMI